MPSFHDSADADAAPEEVWKLLYDPVRFPEWWAGIATVDVQNDNDGGAYTIYPDGYPDFPMAQMLDAHHEGRRLTVSCLVSDLRFEWSLEPLGDGDGGGGDGGGGGRTRIAVDVEIPEAEAARLDGQRETIRASLANLAALASLTVD
jgi:uncharacterized protein YndB with AHSA1/START domain